MYKSFISSLSGNRISNIILGIIYAAFYDYIYVNYICAYLSTYDSAYHILGSLDHTIIYYLLAAIPFGFYKGQRSIAASISLFTYILAYIPIINNLMFWGYSTSLQYSYACVLFISMCLLFMTDNLYIFKDVFKRKRKLIPFRYLEILSIILYILLMFSNRGQLQFVNFIESDNDLFDKRAETNITFIYLLSWLRSAVFPLLIVYYLKKRNYLKYAIVVFAFITFYMLDKLKMTIIYPFILTGLYYIVKFQDKGFTKHFHIMFIGILIVLSLLIMLNLNNPVIFAVSSIFIMRSVCIEGMTFQSYMDFFELHSHPFTYYSHVSVLGGLIGQNPYPESIGLAVMDNESNANAIFWLMDGVAAAGVIGCLISTIIVIVFKSIFNSINIKIPTSLAIVICLYSIMAFVNVSVFTSIVSCGFLIMYLILIFFDVNEFYSPDNNLKYK
jgi:hypothetical protein